MGKDVYRRRLRGGMVGGGPGAFIGPVHRMAATMDGEAELVAGCFSRDAAKSRRAGESLHLDPARVYSSYREMAEKEAKRPAEQRLDFVSIVATTSAHYEIARSFVEHGMNVVCDKPMTTSLEDARTLRDLVRKAKTAFVLTHNYTGYPMVKEARHRVARGELGRVNKVVVEYPQGWLSQLVEGGASGINMWRMDPAQAGPSNCTGDIGIHAENLCRYVTGLEIEELCAETTSFIPGHRLDDDSMALLRFKGGAKGILYASQISSGEENGLTIRAYGTKKGLQWSQEEPNYLLLKDPSGFQTRLSRGNPVVEAALAKEYTRTPFGHPEGFIEAFANVYREGFKTIRAQVAGDPDPKADHPTVDDGVAGLAFIATVLESARSDRKWTRMKS
ncbi:MAG TPA: Gfo/Idh/MocA family oxidoreductase [Vicinamibacteria bacterium]|nr:Gfo/Idh/MocA family oxidoreductase [Vicinamibacteria bacterium]